MELLSAVPTRRIAGTDKTLTREVRGAQHSADGEPEVRGESITIGAEPIEIKSDSGRGVLLFHGFGDTPQTFEYLAQRLAADGFGVHVPLLPGHGRSGEEFKDSRAADWMSAARAYVANERLRYDQLALGGLSMGAALAVIAADGAAISSLLLFAPYLGMPFPLYLAARGHRLVQTFVSTAESKHRGSIQDPAEARKNLGHAFVTPRLLRELSIVVDSAKDSLERLKSPTLVIQSREDPRVSGRMTRRWFDKLDASDKKLLWTSSGGHVITADSCREEVAAETLRWLRARMKKPA